MFGMSGGALFASVVIGSVGFGFFLYGKKQRRMPHLLGGITLMVYPYFVSGVWLMSVIAGALLGLLYLSTYLGL
jgi:hypothetical protein